eukprot:4085994-Pyramimonas_sp.AAC.1
MSFRIVSFWDMLMMKAPVSSKLSWMILPAATGGRALGGASAEWHGGSALGGEGQSGHDKVAGPSGNWQCDAIRHE